MNMMINKEIMLMIYSARGLLTNIGKEWKLFQVDIFNNSSYILKVSTFKQHKVTNMPFTGTPCHSFVQDYLSIFGEGLL